MTPEIEPHNGPSKGAVNAEVKIVETVITTEVPRIGNAGINAQTSANAAHMLVKAASTLFAGYL
jgi:hypothetical protein